METSDLMPCGNKHFSRRAALSSCLSSLLLTYLLLGLTTLVVVINAQNLRGQISVGDSARRARERLKQRQCHSSNHELCGDGEGIFMCEYDVYGYFATRCVKKSSYQKHLWLHPKNYCGTCNKCFQNTDELRSAVRHYIRHNNTRHSSIAKVYGYPIGTWCVDAVTDFSHLFSGYHEFNEDVGAWNVQSATNMQGMFLEAFSFNGDLSDWDTRRVTDMSLMFDRAYQFQGHGLAGWDTQHVTNFQRMFRIAKHFQEDISGWNTQRVTDLSLMFYRAESVNEFLGDWNVARVTDMSYTFAFAKSFNSSLASWNTQSIQTTRGMFQGATSFAQDLRQWNMQQVTDMSYMFSNAEAFDQQVDTKALLHAWGHLPKLHYRDEMFGVISPIFNQSQILETAASTDLPRLDVATAASLAPTTSASESFY